ncbi:MAG: hypothetical protein DBX40_00220 [Clostridiales bacterium]|nr:MAG: hypothetical protein DBX40_00220 [Clostridiales bacterium]
MKRFTPLQIAALIILGAVVITLAIIAFATGRSLAPEALDVSAPPTAAPEIVVIDLAEPTPSPKPIPMPTPEENPELTPTASPSQQEGDALFTLDILENKVFVAYGVEETTLKQSPGWLTTSALPGEDGMCVVYGHRNRNHLKVLEDVVRGDTITVTMNDGTVYSYTISDITIYENTADLSLPVMDGKTLVMVTCYPFRYSGRAPGKYFVSAVFNQ